MQRHLAVQHRSLTHTHNANADHVALKPFHYLYRFSYREFSMGLDALTVFVHAFAEKCSGFFNQRSEFPTILPCSFAVSS